MFRKPPSPNPNPVCTLLLVVRPSPAKVWPTEVSKLKPGVLLSTRLTTPAMASEPYCAAAPSRSTSMRSIAAIGIAFMSVPAVPRPTVSSTCTRALLWRRLPLTSTSVWSGPRPRSVAGRTASVPSVMDELAKLNDGASICSARPVSVCPESRSRSPGISSTGTGDSSGCRPAERVPTATTSTASATAASSSWTATEPSGSATSRTWIWKPGAWTVSECGPGPSSQRLARPESSVGTRRSPTETVALVTAAPDGSVTRTSRHCPAAVCPAEAARISEAAASQRRNAAERSLMRSIRLAPR